MAIIALKMERYIKMIYFKGGLHLQTSGKKILSQNFIVNLQTYGTSLEKQTWSPSKGRCETLV